MKESESKNQLNEKIQALSLALSTVHTVHRLLLSTLNFEELLPRFARLCLQVLRSEYCAILFLDGNRKNLVLRAHVTPERWRWKEVKKIPLGKGIEGKVAKTGNPYFGKSHLCVPLLDEDVLGIISVREKKDKTTYSHYEFEILITLAEQAVIAFKNAKLYEQQERLAMESIQSLAAILESKRSGENRSSDLLVALALGIASELHLSHEESKMLHYAALLHDVGMITVPEKILTKPTKLTRSEYRLIRDIPAKSAQFVRPLRTLEGILPLILHHTERYDGKGYPRGLKGEEIPLGSRILSVAKAFEAMITYRPYRKKVSVRLALTELKRHEGKQFDPHVVEAFLVFSKKKSFHKLIGRF